MPALMLAVMNGSLDAVNILLEAGQWSTAEPIGGAPIILIRAIGWYQRCRTDERRRIKEAVQHYSDTHEGGVWNFCDIKNIIGSVC
jgi:hypothetical protein